MCTKEIMQYEASSSNEEETIQISIPTAQLKVSSDKQTSCVVYKIVIRIRVSVEDPITTVQVFKTFSELQHFHEDWSCVYPSLASKHVFPSNQFFSPRNMDFITSRQRELERYLRSIVNCKTLSKIVHPFL